MEKKKRGKGKKGNRIGGSGRREGFVGIIVAYFSSRFLRRAREIPRGPIDRVTLCGGMRKSRSGTARGLVVGNSRYFFYGRLIRDLQRRKKRKKTERERERDSQESLATFQVRFSQAR